MNDSKNQPTGKPQNQGQPQQGQSDGKDRQPNAPKPDGAEHQQEQKQAGRSDQEGDKSSSPS